MSDITDYVVPVWDEVTEGEIDGKKYAVITLGIVQPTNQEAGIQVAVMVMDSQDALMLSKHIRDRALEIPSMEAQADKAGEESNPNG